MSESNLEKYLGENKLIHLAQESIDKFTEISNVVESTLSQSSSYRPGILADSNYNAFTNIINITNTVQQGDQKLKSEPAVGRVVIYFPEKKETKIYYICRATPPTKVGNLISYRGQLGRLAALEIGETYDMGEETGLEKYDEQDIIKIQQATYIPVKTSAGWDSRKTEYIDSTDLQFKTINSLLKVIEKQEDIDPEKILERYLQEQQLKSNVIDGIRKEIVEKFTLPDQMFLDSQQDGIFRLPLNYSLLLLGPAGTGKTTTLIRRLGQKLDFENGLMEEEQNLALRIFETKEAYRSSWIMFTPTDLLKSYLKEAFNRESVPASEATITTWDSYRIKLGRDVLRILKTTKFDSGFLYSQDTMTLQEDFDALTELSSEFYKWLIEGYLNELFQALEKLASQGLFKETSFINKCYDLITNSSRSNRFYLDEIFSLIFMNHKQISEWYKKERKEIETAINIDLGNKLKNDNKFLDNYSDFLASLENNEQGEADENEVTDTDIIDDDDENDNLTAADRIKILIRKYRSFIMWLASKPADFDAGKSTSRNTRQLEWLGDRVPPRDVLDSINQSAVKIKNISPLYNSLNKFYNSIASRYGRFRKLKQAESRFYNADAALRKRINGTELDLLIFTKLRIAADLLRTQQLPQNESGFTSCLKPVRENYKAQVLVDEAPDFSPIQLGCMKLLAHPKINSFFACGDFNQRLASEGTKDVEVIKDFLPGGKIEEKYISIPYRQTKSLYRFSLKVLNMISGNGQASGHQENVHANEGFRPVLGENLEGRQLSSWIVDRIIEIETTLNGNIPSIAILVPTEEYVAPIAREIKESLNQETCALVQACHEGQTVGDGRAIRVFDIKHIKGLEFEAAFFVSLDKLAQLYPALIGNYLYVGATRAAQFLGVTCEKELPGGYGEVLRETFVTDWSV